jgi:hypothetical protein
MKDTSNRARLKLLTIAVSFVISLFVFRHWDELKELLF